MRERPVLIVAVDPALQGHLTSVVEGLGYETVLKPTLDGALSVLANEEFLGTLVQADLTSYEEHGHLRVDPHRSGPVIFVGDGRPGPSALLVRQPFDRKNLETVVRDALAARRDDRFRREMALWCSPKMMSIRDIVQRAAEVDVTVLVTGETGTGKDLVARAIHSLSPRQAQDFVKVNCAAVPRELLESELFGHEKGAFTGAHELKLGKFEAAHRGTIFLDEIGDLHPALQAKLLHVLQDGEFSRVGGKANLKVDVRVLAATNQDLEKAVADGRFREDLYYRLNVIQIAVPPLRERKEEIPALAQYFVERYAAHFRRADFTIPRATMDRLLQHHYPGNIRELENLVKRMVVLSDPLMSRSFDSLGGSRAHPDGAPPADKPPAVSLKEIARSASRAAEREAITMMLERTGWNRTKAASLLQISYRALLYKIKQAGLGTERSTPAGSSS